MRYVYKSITTICSCVSSCVLFYLAIVHLSGLKSLVLIIGGLIGLCNVHWHITYHHPHKVWKLQRELESLKNS
jgi:uncharacterized Tic20 family protein